MHLDTNLQPAQEQEIQHRSANSGNITWHLHGFSSCRAVEGCRVRWLVRRLCRVRCECSCPLGPNPALLGGRLQDFLRIHRPHAKLRIPVGSQGPVGAQMNGLTQMSTSPSTSINNDSSITITHRSIKCQTRVNHHNICTQAKASRQYERGLGWIGWIVSNTSTDTSSHTQMHTHTHPNAKGPNPGTTEEGVGRRYVSSNLVNTNFSTGSQKRHLAFLWQGMRTLCISITWPQLLWA